MRDELMISRTSAMGTAASRAIESRMSPIEIPPPVTDANGRSVSTVTSRKFGVRVEVPDGALPNGSKMAVQTRSPQSVEYLTDAASRRRGEFVFSSVVQVDIFDGDGDRMEVTWELGRLDTKASEPPTLVMPHAFCPTEGHESIVLLGAPHGTTQWQVLESNLLSNPITLVNEEMRVKLPYPGVRAEGSIACLEL